MSRMKPGSILARRYRVQRLLGRGMGGEVHLAEALDTGGLVGIKLVSEPFAQAGAGVVVRLREEARVMAAIGGERVQRVIELVEDAERGPLLVYERLEGESLCDRLVRGGPMR